MCVSLAPLQDVAHLHKKRRDREKQADLSKRLHNKVGTLPPPPREAAMKSGGNWVGGRDETGGRDVKVWLWMLLEWRLDPGPWQPKNTTLSKIWPCPSPGTAQMTWQRKIKKMVPTLPPGHPNPAPHQSSGKKMRGYKKGPKNCVFRKVFFSTNDKKTDEKMRFPAHNASKEKKLVSGGGRLLLSDILEQIHSATSQS